MMRRSVRWTISVIVAVGAASLSRRRRPPATTPVTSFDGTRIVLSFFPAEGLQPGQKAPTVLIGPGWSSGRDTDENSASSDLFGSTGVGPFRRAGYNVLTWDPRGFGESGGTVQVDSPQYEGRDVQALISYVAQQPEAKLDGAGDPRVGMSGASYGGGIQLVTAAIDSRRRRDRAGHRLALARHQPLQGPVAEVRLGLGAVRAGRRGRHDPGDSRG